LPTPLPSVSCDPLRCSFDEDECSFTNDLTHPWVRNSGSTGTILTGPSADYETGSGSYMYVESSSPNVATGPFRLTTTEFTLRSESADPAAFSVTFAYHMYGDSMGSLLVAAQSSEDSQWRTVWTKGGNQGSSWRLADVSINASTVIHTIVAG
jgi:hypothetical protein